MLDAVLISPEQLATMMDTAPVVVIDTRDADTYAAGHLPGAVNLRQIFTFLATSTAEGMTALKFTLPSTLAPLACLVPRRPCFMKTP